MKKNKFKTSEALLEYMLEGNRVSLLEAMLLFGVQSPNRVFTTFKRKGFKIDYQKVSMAKILRRINEFTLCKAPQNLPYKEIDMVEYWINR